MGGHFQEFEDEYLETMYAFYENAPQSLVRTGDLASALKVSPASKIGIKRVCRLYSIQGG